MTRSVGRSPTWPLLLAAIVALALALRLWGIQAHAPFVYNSTEHVVLHRALDIVRERDLDPHWFQQPPLLIYIQVLFVSALQPFVHAPLTTNAALNGIGPWDVLPAQWPFLLAGRIFVALAGTAAVVCIGITGRRWHSPGAGAVAALLLAVLPLGVDRAHFLATEVPAAALVAATLWITLRVQATRMGWFFAGGCAGFAAATSYSATFVVLAPLVAACEIRRPLATLERFIYVSGGAVAAFLLACPYALLDLSSLLQGLAEQREYLAGVAVSHPWRWYLGDLWHAELYPGAAAAALVGMGVAIYRGRRVDWAMSLPPIAYLALLAVDPASSERSLLVLLPFACLFAGGALAELRGQFFRPPLAHGAIAFVALALAFAPARGAFRSNQARTRPDTRTLAWHWINDHLPAESCVAREEYTPQVSPARYHVEYIGALAQRPYRWYLADGCTYLVASSYTYDALYNPPQKAGPTAAEFYRILFTLPRLAEFAPGPGTSGPTIRIIQLPLPSP